MKDSKQGAESKSKDKLVTKLSLAFNSRWRIAILLLVSILGLGYFSYTTLLPRDGFPTIAFPASNITAIYFVGDAEKFEEEIINPIEDVLEAEEGIKSVTTTTDGKFGNIFVQFNDEVENSEVGTELIQNAIEESVVLPETAQLQFTAIKVGSIDNVSDLVFTLSADNEDVEYREIQSRAEDVKALLLEEDGINDVVISEVITEQINPATGESFEFQKQFTRIGIKLDGGLQFFKGVSIGIIADDGLSSAEISTIVRDAMETIADNGEINGYSVTYIGDPAVSTDEQIQSLESNLATGMLAVMIVLLLFVSWRASIVTVIFIPTVLALSFVLMYIFGYTLNVISLFALILALGLLVDDAIVIIEAIDFNKRNGIKGIEAIRKSINEVGAADIMGSLTTILVFTPMLFTQGILGEFIKELPSTVIITLASSLFVALTITPFLSNKLIRYNKSKKTATESTGSITEYLKKFSFYVDKAFDFFPSLITRLGVKIGEWTKYSLEKKWPAAIVLVASVTLIVIGLAFAQYMFQNKFNPFPPTKDSDVMSLTISRDESSTLQETEAVAIDVEKKVSDVFNDEIESYDYFISTARQVYISVNLTPLGDREITSPEISAEINKMFSYYNDGSSVKAEPAGVGPMAEEYPFKVQVYSEDQEVLETVSAEVAAFVEGKSIGDESVEDVRVNHLLSITKLDGRRYAEVTAKLSDNNNTQLILDLQEEVKAEFDPERLAELGAEEDTLGYDLGQQSENLASLESLYVAGAISLILMYALLVWQFNSFSQPLLIIVVAVLLAFPGVYPGLYYTDNYISFLVTVGLIGLIGIVVNNTIMLVDFANQARAKGENSVDAISHAIKIRMRPLLTTTTTTVFGLLPLAIAEPFWEPIAFTIIFGLIASTSLVIFAFPSYYVVNEWLRKFRKPIAIGLSVLLAVIIGALVVLG